MPEHTFTLHLTSLPTDDEIDRLLAPGCCDDGTVSISDGRASVDFDRDAPTIDGAIASALADVRSVGLDVDSVDRELDAQGDGDAA